jgi:hypothetical protein
MKKILLTIALLSTAPTALLCSENPTRKIETDPFKKVEKNLLMNISYFGVAGLCVGSGRFGALTSIKKELDNIWYPKDRDSFNPLSCDQKTILKKIIKNIKISKGLMGISSLAILAPIIIPTTIDTIKRMNAQKTAFNQE